MRAALLVALLAAFVAPRPAAAVTPISPAPGSTTTESRVVVSFRMDEYEDFLDAYAARGRVPARDTEPCNAQAAEGDPERWTCDLGVLEPGVYHWIVVYELLLCEGDDCPQERVAGPFTFTVAAPRGASCQARERPRLTAAALARAGTRLQLRGAGFLARTTTKIVAARAAPGTHAFAASMVVKATLRTSAAGTFRVYLRVPRARSAWTLYAVQTLPARCEGDGALHWAAVTVRVRRG